MNLYSLDELQRFNMEPLGEYDFYNIALHDETDIEYT